MATAKRVGEQPDTRNSIGNLGNRQEEKEVTRTNGCRELFPHYRNCPGYFSELFAKFEIIIPIGENYSTNFR